MRLHFIFLLCLPGWVFCHSSQISTLALVKDTDGRWTAHISASLETCQVLLGNRSSESMINFQQKLIEYMQSAIHIRSSRFNSAQLTNGQCRIGHQTDLKFQIKGIRSEADDITIETEIFKKSNEHFILLKVINEKKESNQFILTAGNNYSAQVDLSRNNIFITETNPFSFRYLLLIPILFIPLLIKLKMKPIIPFVLLCCIISSCNTNNTVTPTTDVPEVFKKIYGAKSITSDGTYVIIQSKALPDHSSPYYPESNGLYQAYSGLTFGGLSFVKNPNFIVEQSGTIKIPINPKVAATHSATPLGPIGIALNGVPFFNQYAGPNNQELKGEMATFDQYYGHPQQSGIYHYHVEPLYLTTVKSTKSGLMGFLLDGFPVYGPYDESGLVVSNSDLDIYHGHIHATLDYPDGIYHYHFTSEAPYLNGNGFYGTPGTVSQ